MRVLQVNAHDIGGGAERIAQYLFQGLRQQGHVSYLAVGRQISCDPSVLAIPKTAWWNVCERVGEALSSGLASRGLGGSQTIRRISSLGDPRRGWDYLRGVEDFNYAGSASLLDLPPE